jgi:hypothetical protein
MPHQQSTPWAILKCRFAGDAQTEPFPAEYYTKLFTSAGVGLNNMVDFFRDYTHGHIDVGGSHVHGWFELGHRRFEYTGSGANPQGRQQLVQWAQEAAIANGVDLTPYYAVAVCMNLPTDLFGGGRGVVTPSGDVRNDMSPSMLAQEMLHCYGVDHSRLDGSVLDYRDRWDIMSTATNAFMSPDANFYRIGPGLNAANMDGRGWLEPQRCWGTGGFFSEVVQLRPHHRRDLPGFLVARAGMFYIEFRMKEGWDAAIDRPAVLVHRFQDNHSYLMLTTAGGQSLGVGEVFSHVDQSTPGRVEARVEVASISASNKEASVRISWQPTLGTMLLTVEPYPAPWGRAVQMTVHARDSRSGAPIQGEVVIDNYSGTGVPETIRFPTGTTKSVTLRIGRGRWHGEQPRGVVTAAPYADVEIDFGF